MIAYRAFRNMDPPGIVQVWNESFLGRGAARLSTSTPFECYVLAKPYFDRQGLIVAEEDGAIVGFAHAGFGPDQGGADLATTEGAICAVGVRPTHQRHGIGSELLRRAEDYLRQRGAVVIYAGPHEPLNPFYFGLYGGSNSPGFLESDPQAAPFLTKHGYQVCRQNIVLHRSLQRPIKVFDARFSRLRDGYNLRLASRKHLASWYQECQFALAEPLEFFLEDKATQQTAGRARIWEMDMFSLRWNMPAIGISSLEVAEKSRRQGLAKYLLMHLLRLLQEQYYEVAEFQADASATACLKLCRDLGFEQVDRGQVFKKIT